MQELSTVFALAALLFSVIAALIALLCVRRVRLAEDWLASSNKKSIALKQLTQLELDMTDHADAIASINKTLKSLRSRIGMRELRARNDDSVPDQHTDPEGFKRVMRQKLHLGKLNGKR